MTKVQIHFRVRGPLDDALMARMADIRSVYGILAVRVGASLDTLAVEYDATRMTPADVEAILAGAGIPVERV
jgi:hypothetical protein